MPAYEGDTGGQVRDMVCLWRLDSMEHVRVFGPYATIEDATEVARHDGVWELNNQRQYVHSSGQRLIAKHTPPESAPAPAVLVAAQ